MASQINNLNKIVISYDNEFSIVNFIEHLKILLKDGPTELVNDIQKYYMLVLNQIMNKKYKNLKIKAYIGLQKDLPLLYEMLEKCKIVKSNSSMSKLKLITDFKDTMDRHYQRKGTNENEASVEAEFQTLFGHPASAKAASSSRTAAASLPRTSARTASASLSRTLASASPNHPSNNWTIITSANIPPKDPQISRGSTGSTVLQRLKTALSKKKSSGSTGGRIKTKNSKKSKKSNK